MIRPLRRERMEALTRGVKASGGVIHMTARGGLCAHEGPNESGSPIEPLPGADQEGAEWLMRLVTKLWPEGVPDCPNNQPGDQDA